MNTMSYSDFRANLANKLDKVNEETTYLMASPENAMRLNRAIAQIEGGIAKSRTLIEE